MSERRRKVAHVEDVDDEGNVIEGTDRYAETEYDASTVSPSKEREIPNTGRTRRERTRRDSISPTSGLTDSDSTLHPRRDSLRSREPERRLSTRDNKKAMVPSHIRPPVKHAKTTPSVPKEASYYGVTPPTVTPSSSRPRAHTSRPQSVYTNSRPPAANTRWYQNQAPPPLQQLPVGSYPLPSWGGGTPYPIPPPSPSPVVSQSPVDYFSSRPLEARFGTSGPRPQSSIGFRPPTRAIPFDDYVDHEERRPPAQPRYSDRRGSMAPPPRPASARPVSLAIRPPPGTPARRVFDDQDFAGESDLFHDISPRTNNYTAAPISRRRSQSRRRPSSSIYDEGNYRTEVAVAKPIPNGRPNRRASYYGGQSSSSGSYEDKLNQAAQYQDEITRETGPPGMQLTAERLRKAARHGGSRSSTRSSGSRDESDFRQSATTRTTRSSAAGEEDMTIRVKGNAVLEVGGAKMRCQDGTEINISRGPPLATGFRTSSDQSSYLGQEDRRARMDRPPNRHRASSQAASFSRSTPQYEDGPGYYPPPPSRYEVPPPSSRYEVPPPYPAYPSVFPSRPRGDYI